MTRSECRTLAEALMREHRIPTDPTAPGAWRFEFDNAKRRLGLCSYRRRTIFLSKGLVDCNDWEKVRQTMLHEIAHVMAGPFAGHSHRWLVLAREIGYTGQRCTDLQDSDIAMPASPWKGTCPGGHEHRAYRQPKRERSCIKCFPHNHKFNPTYLITWSRT